MDRCRTLVGAAAKALGLGLAGEASARGKELTLCWATWDPASALVELAL